MLKSHAYRDLKSDALEEHFSHYLIDSWSYSGVSTFSRNEKAFEMGYIYREPFRASASAIAGQAYHKALKFYFQQLKDGVAEDIVRLQMEAFEHINNVSATDWKIQKTTPTVEKCQLKATDLVTKFLENFFHDISIYMDEIKEVLYVEVRMEEFLTINGVDIPLPCHGILDLIIKTNDNKTVIIDHKSKNKFSDEKDLAFSVGKQAITYVNLIEATTDLKIDEVWFVENKSSQNKDESPQLNCFKIEIDKDTKRLYEAMLYENLKRMIEAVSDVNYIYLMNEDDSFVDKAEMHEFWSRTMMLEVEDFNIPDNKRELMEKRLKKIRDTSIAMVDPKAIKNFRKNASAFIKYNLNNKDMTKEQKIEHVLQALNTRVEVVHKFDGYSSDTFLLRVDAGVKLASVTRHKMDIASALGVPSVRIMKELYVYESEAFLAVESSKKREKDLLFNKKYLTGMKIPIGIDNFNKPVYWDLMNQSTPHVLICGATGSGKSVCIDSIIEFASLADVSDIVILDPKYEFTKLSKKKGMIVYQEIADIERVVKELVEEMNKMIESGEKRTTLVVLDEFADAFLMARKGKDLDVEEMVEVGVYKQSIKEQQLELKPQPKMGMKVTHQAPSLQDNLQSLLQKGRSSGFRLILATQRASAKIISGDLKVNLPVQICFYVPKEVDSKVVIDESGAESLAGEGDGLMKSPENAEVVRFQAFYKKD